MKKQLVDKFLDYYNLSQEEFEHLLQEEDILDSNAKCILEFVNFLKKKQTEQKKILVVGDYDCDGLASTSILLRLFKKLGFTTKFYIPDREDDGYGLTVDILKKAKNHFDLIVTIDNGVKATEAILYAKKENMTLAIIDHHQYEVAPDVDFFIHQNLLEEEFEYFSASGLALLIARQFYYDDYDIILASIGLTADMMKVFRQTRAILKKAHKLLQEELPLQIQCLLGKEYSVDSLSFEICPKINAVSRVGLVNVNEVVHYLISEDNDFIRTYAMKINELNSYRKKLTEKYVQYIEKQPISDSFIEVVYHPEFKEGLCGLLANRLCRSLGKPVLVISKSKESLKGSGRSVGNFDLYHYFKDLDLLSKFGGHQKAIGFSLKEENFEKLTNYIQDNPDIVCEEEVRYISIEEDDLTQDLQAILEKLQPYGEGLNPVLFRLDKPSIKSFYMIKNMYPKWSSTFNLDAISFEHSTKIQEPEFLLGTLSCKNKKNFTMIVKRYF